MPVCLPAGAGRHATAAIIINENADPGFRQDVLSLLDKLIPDGKLLLGTWQGITLVELDGPREREIIVDVRP